MELRQQLCKSGVEKNTDFINCVNISYYKHVIHWIGDTENVFIQECVDKPMRCNTSYE